MNKPPAIIGLHHIALNVADLAACEQFYIELLGFAVEWRPDSDNLYLTSGADNLALHKSDKALGTPGASALDHLGLVVKTPDDVDQWHTFLVAQGVRIVKEPRTHRDGARSFYFLDPEDNTIQLIYHPPLSDV